MRRFAPIAVAVAVATFAFAFAPAASADLECDGMQRSFSGELQKANDKMIVVDNKKGDKIKFQQHETTTVTGTRTSWDDLKKGDYVTVCSKMLEKPRYAYKVEASEPPSDDD
jgi:hypothetical protein